MLRFTKHKKIFILVGACIFLIILAYPIFRIENCGYWHFMLGEIRCECEEDFLATKIASMWEKVLKMSHLQPLVDAGPISCFGRNTGNYTIGKLFITKERPCDEIQMVVCKLLKQANYPEIVSLEEETKAKLPAGCEIFTSRPKCEVLLKQK